MTSPRLDAIIIGSGPNGLAAAIHLAKAGRGVHVIEAHEVIGGGVRSRELTLPGFKHDVCSAVHPLGIASPFFKTLPLERHGLKWIHSEASLAHPLPEGRAVVMERRIEAMRDVLGRDYAAYERLYGRLVKHADELYPDALAPVTRAPRHPFLLTEFGLKALRSCEGLTKAYFKDEPARALFAGIAAHSAVPLDRPLSAAIGMMLGIAGHAAGWPIPEGGAERLSGALAHYAEEMGVTFETSRRITKMTDLPEAKAYFFDLAPRDLVRIAGDRLSERYRRALERYRYGAGVFKLDWALSAPIPWTAPAVKRAATVHVGGTLAEIAASERAAWMDRALERPFVILAQPTLFDPSRAPAGQHIAWGYCHVPHGATQDMTAAIENQIERFAPGFKDLILARHVMSPRAFETYNANYVGGDINVGAMNLKQAFFRPTVRLNPYATSDRRIFLCSSATPPGGGVHGMCGFHAARAALAFGVL